MGRNEGVGIRDKTRDSSDVTRSDVQSYHCCFIWSIICQRDVSFILLNVADTWSKTVSYCHIPILQVLLSSRHRQTIWNNDFFILKLTMTKIIKSFITGGCKSRDAFYYYCLSICKAFTSTVINRLVTRLLLLLS